MFIPPVHFKMEGMHIFEEILKKNDWMMKVDLKDAYTMMLIQEDDRKFLCFTAQNHLFSSLVACCALYGI